MKILMAYDGSSHADAAVGDLARAGMPAVGEARVVTVADVMMPPSLSHRLVAGERESESLRDAPPHAAGAMRSALDAARKGAERAKAALPGWTIEAVAVADTAAWGVIRESDTWQPDLVVVGTHGRGAVARLVMGSVSHKVLTEGRCNVRIARPRPGSGNDLPPRLIVAVDGSRGSDAALETVARRRWRAGTEVLLLCVFESRMAIAPPHAFDDERTSKRSALERAAARLVASGPELSVTTLLREGEPIPILVDQAEEWSADCIFLGARGLGAMDRMLLGSVSTAVAMRARCSVELVQGPHTGLTGA
jgi:nucleotide-binding universal stress UspA family protein